MIANGGGSQALLQLTSATPVASEKKRTPPHTRQQTGGLVNIDSNTDRCTQIDASTQPPPPKSERYRTVAAARACETPGARRVLPAVTTHVPRVCALYHTQHNTKPHIRNGELQPILRCHFF